MKCGKSIAGGSGGEFRVSVGSRDLARSVAECTDSTVERRCLPVLYAAQFDVAPLDERVRYRNQNNVLVIENGLFKVWSNQA